MLTELLTENRVRLRADVRDWKHAARALGELLLHSGDVEQCYLDAMVRSVEEEGAYVVLTAGFALFHARPEDGVNRQCAAVMTLDQPVDMGERGPVDVVFAFASPESDAHILLLQKIADLLLQSDFLPALRTAETPAALLSTIRRFESEHCLS